LVYVLELTQVDNYIAQAKLIEDQYIARALERFSFIEQQHVDNIAAQLKRFDAVPNKTGDMMAPWIGKIMGNVLGASGVFLLLEINSAIEQKAMSDYKQLIAQVDDADLLETLWSNLIDEDLHTAWMLNKAKQLATQGEKTKDDL